VTERIGVYRVEGRLGRGGMGEVLLAWDDRLERRVAIKRIRQDEGLSAEQRERFRREARLAARLNHSSVVQIHDLVTEGPDDAIVMEYVEGQTLAECLKSGPLAIDEALRLGREIAEGLAAAHEAGLIHRDLKAANVIVTKARRAKILDFGLARPVIHSPEEEPLTRHGMVMGTFHAMSPEQARGEALDERSDLFSFGALLYEMLTGRAPFRGNDAIDSLRRVVQEPPADPRSIRPDLTAEVVALLDRLLAKDRRDRPAGAGEVVAILERLRPASGSTPSFERDDTVSDLPTAPARAAGGVPALVRAEAAAPLSSTSLPLKRRWLLLTLPVLGLLLFLGSREPERPPIRVYMPEPTFEAGDEQLNIAASAMQAASLGFLSSLEGISAIDPMFVRGDSSSPQVLARETAAEELLLSSVERQGGMVYVSLRRVRVVDQTVLGTEDFKISLAPEEQSQLARAITVHLREIYPKRDFRLRPGTPELDVREEDFAAFMRVQQDLNDGKLLLAPALFELGEITNRSPRFLEGHLLAAQVALSLFLSTRDVDLPVRARAHIRQAQALAPNDPRPIIVELQADRTENKLQDAEAALKELGRLLPGDPEVLVQKALLREHQGRLDEAVVALRTAADRAPAWKTLLWLAELEAKTGDVEEARRRFDEILGQKTNNPWVLETAGQMEMSYGSLQKAEKIYRDLARRNARFSYFNNLGLIHTLRGQHHQAAASYSRALDIAPGNAGALLNLAESKLGLGQKNAAEALYRKALQKISEQKAATSLPPMEVMTEAQCLARLGQNREAFDLAQQVLQESPQDATINFLAAQVFSLTGDRNPAVSSVLEASSRGIKPRWFKLSAFDPIRDEPELRSLLNSSDGS
jgi:serine/threonine protein kinase/tetratricopeptide (TPR) repeat protein